MRQLSNLSDEMLLDALTAIVGSHRRVTAELISHLGEVDARRLHADKGFPSLFAYCVERLGFSEDEACRRIDAARLVRRFPAIVSLLESGEVSITVLGLLKHHLTDENQGELLAGVSGASVRQAKEWLAERFPAPDVASSIRKQPMRQGPLPAEVHSMALPVAAPPAIAPDLPTRAETALPGVATVRPGSPAPTRAAIDPLSRERFLVKFTASRAMRDKIELARDLMRHANPGGDLVEVLERALDLLIAELEKKKQGRAERPRDTSRAAAGAITRASRREVVARDGWRCSFVSDDGKSCDSRAFLEFDHETPKGLGGTSDAHNLRLLCRTHNRLAAERVYGKAHVSVAISRSRGKKKGPLMVRERNVGRAPWFGASLKEWQMVELPSPTNSICS